jgi:hypothetical protein
MMTAADARSGGGFGGGHMGGFGSGGHVGGFGGSHIGGRGFGDHFGSANSGFGQHALHRFRGVGGNGLYGDDGFYGDDGLNCYDPSHHRPGYHWQSSCS